MLGEVKTCDYSLVANCAEEHTEARASFHNDTKHVCQFICGGKMRAN